jgi:polysaccharide biosynthesis protein PelC
MKHTIATVLTLISLAFATAGCAVYDHANNPQTLERGAKWVMLPILNFTETPQAGLRVEAIAEAQLRTLGIAQLQRYPATLNNETLFEPAERKAVEEAVKWAKAQGYRYGVTGSVEEWRYKVGVDGEPAVGVALQIVDLQSEGVVWNALGAKTGWSREAVSAVAQKVVKQLLSGVRFG